MKTNKIKTNNDEENIKKVYEPETVIKLLNYIESAMDSWLRNERYNIIAIDEDTADENGYLYLNICKNNVEIIRKIVKSYYISDDGEVKSKGNNEK
jgi:hypothetical protein